MWTKKLLLLIIYNFKSKYYVTTNKNRNADEATTALFWIIDDGSNTRVLHRTLLTTLTAIPACGVLRQ